MTGITPTLKRSSAMAAAAARNSAIQSIFELFWPFPSVGRAICAMKKPSEAGDHADHRRRDGHQWHGEMRLAVGRFHQRSAGQDEDERGQEGEPGHPPAASAAPRNCRSGPSTCCVQPPRKPAKATTMTKGPGVVSPSACQRRTGQPGIAEAGMGGPRIGVRAGNA